MSHSWGGTSGDGSSEREPSSPINDISDTRHGGGGGRRRSHRGKRRSRDGLAKRCVVPSTLTLSSNRHVIASLPFLSLRCRTMSGREYGEGVQLIPVVRVESSPELSSTRADPFSPPVSPQAAVDGSIHRRRRGDTVGRLRRTTSLMPVPHLAPSPNRNATAGSTLGGGAGAGTGVSSPAVVYDPFMTDGDHTALGMLLLNLGGASSIDPRWAPPGGGGKSRRRGKMRGESRLGAAPPRGGGAWADLAPSLGAKARAAAREMSL
jgi:hypothetical protein